MPFLPLLAQSVTIPPDRPKVGEKRVYDVWSDVTLSQKGLKYELSYEARWTTEVTAASADGSTRLKIDYSTRFAGETEPAKSYEGIADALPDGSLTGKVPVGWARYTRMTSFVPPAGPVAPGAEWSKEGASTGQASSPAHRIVYRLKAVEDKDGKRVALVDSVARETEGEPPMEAETSHTIDLVTGERIAWTVQFRHFKDDAWDQSGRTVTSRSQVK